MKFEHSKDSFPYKNFNAENSVFISQNFTLPPCRYNLYKRVKTHPVGVI